MFYAQAAVCDEYFVKSIEICCENNKIPDEIIQRFKVLAIIIIKWINYPTFCSRAR